MSVRLDIDAMRALQAIADLGGVTRAADQLSLSQSAVSHKIKRLEENIQCSLLNRKPGLPLLTDSGQRLLGYANRILAIHDEALISLSKRTLSGSIRLGMTEDMTCSGLASILGRFARLFPNVSVRTHVSQSLLLQDEIEAGAIDLAVMQIFASDITENDILLEKNHLCWVKALDFDLEASSPVPFLAYDDNCFYKKWMLEHGSSQSQRFRTVLQCASNAGIIAGIEAGLGVSILNRQHVTPAMEEIEDRFVTPPDISYIVRTSVKGVSNAVTVLANEIAREAAQTSVASFSPRPPNGSTASLRSICIPPGMRDYRSHT